MRLLPLLPCADASRLQGSLDQFQRSIGTLIDTSTALSHSADARPAREFAKSMQGALLLSRFQKSLFSIWNSTALRRATCRDIRRCYSLRKQLTLADVIDVEQLCWNSTGPKKACLLPLFLFRHYPLKLRDASCCVLAIR